MALHRPPRLHRRLLAAIHAIDHHAAGRPRHRRSAFAAALAEVALAVGRPEPLADAMRRLLDSRPAGLSDRDSVILASIPVGLALPGDYEVADRTMQTAGEAIGHAPGTTFADLARIVGRAACAIGARCDLRDAILMVASAPVHEPLAVSAMAMAAGEVPRPEPRHMRGEHEIVGSSLSLLRSYGRFPMPAAALDATPALARGLVLGLQAAAEVEW